MNLVLAALGASVVTLAAAMLPPRVNSAMPPGAQRGTEIDLVVRGERLAAPFSLLTVQPGVELVGQVPGKTAQECTLKVRVAADAPLGAHALRLSAQGGLSNVFHLFVGAQLELPEVRKGGESQRVPVPSTISAELQDEEIDRYTVQLGAGANCVVEVEAMRLLRGPVDLALQVVGPGGVELGRCDDTALGHKDPLLSFRAPVAGAYEIRVAQAFPDRQNVGAYRLHLGDLPRPTACVPTGVEPGVRTALLLLGDGALATTEVELRDDGSGYAPVFVADARGATPTPLWVRVGGPREVAVARSADPSDVPLLPYPASTTGVVDSKDGIRFRVAAKKGENFEFRVLTLGLRSPLDPVIGVRDAKGTLLAGDDDSGAPGADAFVKVAAKADGELFVTVRDLLRRHSPAHLFRLEAGVREKSARTRMVVVRGQDPSVSVPVGGSQGGVLQLDDVDFDAGPALAMNGLPAGVTATFGPVVKGQNLVPFVLSAAADAPRSVAACDLAFACQKEPLVRDAGYLQTLPLVVVRNDQPILTATQTKLPISVCGAVPFAMAIEAPSVPIVRGAPLAVAVRVMRAEGFAGEVRLKALWTPNGVTAGEVVVPKDKDRALLPLDASANAPLGPFSLAVRGAAQQGNDSWEACSLFAPVVVEEPWVSAKVEALRTKQGSGLEWPFELASRVEKANVPVQARLLSLPRGVEAEPVTLDGATNAGRFQLKVASDAAVGRHKNAVVELRVLSAGGEVVHRVGAGELRIDEPKKKPVAADAAAKGGAK